MASPALKLMVPASNIEPSAQVAAPLTLSVPVACTSMVPVLLKVNSSVVVESPVLR
jgi:hypothetical protein